jgi:hypothetical protein
VVRRLLFCAWLCVAAWTVGELLAVNASNDGANSNAAASLSNVPQDANSEDHQWIAARRVTASTTESGWRAQLQQVSLATVLGALVADARHRPHFSHRPARHAPNRPSVIPLLI